MSTFEVEIGNPFKLLLMIIKVPIYVEVEKVPEGTDLREEISLLSEVMSSYLRGKKYNLFDKHDLERWNDLLGNFKILSYGQALDSLRKK